MKNPSIDGRSSGYIYPLDLLRIFCALLIFLFHMNLQFEFQTGNLIADRFISSGNFTMTTFFILSGYVLYIQNSERDFVKLSNITEFYLRRWIAIYPPYIFLVIFYYFGTQFNLADTLVKNALLVPAFLLGMQCFFQDLHSFVGNSLLWFVSVLLFLYVIYPFAQILVERLSGYATAMLLILYLAIVYISLIYAYFRNAQVFYYNNPFFRVPEFIFGIVLAKVYKSSRFRCIKGIAAFFAAVLVVVCVSYLQPKLFFGAAAFRAMSLLYNFITVPLAAVIILGLSNSDNTFLIKLCKSKIIRYASSLTYGFYLTQGLVIRIMRKLTCVDGFLFVFIALWLNIMFAVVMYEVVQKGSKKFLNKRLKLN